MQNKIVVMGGSFNPPTLAHFGLMLEAVKQLDAKKGIFVPSNHDYVYTKMRRQNRKKEVFSEEERQRMLHIMCGSREFLERFRILVVEREDFQPETMIQEHPFLKKYPEAFSFIKPPKEIEGISSSKVRDLLRAGDETAAKMLHPDVWQMAVDKGWLKKDIDRFRGDFDFLSNFYEAPVTYDGLSYGSSEAAFQAQKCASEEEKQTFCQMRPSRAKQAGRKVTLREDWEAIKLERMEGIVRAKFMQNPPLAAKLLATKDRKIEERNTWHDVFWGVDAATGKGGNHLGKILMKIRDELKNQEK